MYGKVRVRDEELAEGHGVGFAFVEELLTGVPIEGFIGHEDSAEYPIEAGADAIGANAVLLRTEFNYNIF